MIEMRLSAAAESVAARLRGEDRTFHGLSTDSRKLSAGELFVALQGEHFDGLQFVPEARRLGAAAALVNRWVDVDIPQLACADTLIGLGKLAGAWRQRQFCTVVGITGSNGKTTVKTMLQAILCQGAETLANSGNFNNEIGLPLTICGLSAKHRFAVLEMGAARPGDIAYLAAIARPQVALINNAAGAHLQGMGSIAGVARVKGELIQALPGDGIAVINGDDQHADYWREIAGERRVIAFGLDPRCEVSGSYQPVGEALAVEIITPAGAFQVTLNCLGEHNVANALAACAAALALERPVAEIRRGLEAFVPVEGRLRPRAMASGWTLIEDTYNANPASLAAGLRAAAQLPGELWLVLGDMGELGDDSAALHFQAGAQAQRLGVKRLFCLGELSRHSAAGFGDGARFYPDRDPLIEDLRDALGEGVVCLIKGSRAMRMEQVAAALGGN